MSETFGTFGPQWTTLPRIVERVSRALMRWVGARRGFHQFDSAYAARTSESFRRKMANGERTYLLGLSPCSHNTGASLVECSRDGGIRIISNDEEERFRAEKFCTKFPTMALDAVKARMAAMRLSENDLHCVLIGWDYISLLPLSLRTMFQHAPWSLALARSGATHGGDLPVIRDALRASSRLAQSGIWASDLPVPVIGMAHHGNHAYMAYAAAPLRGTPERPVLVAVLDGFGDAGAISVYTARGDDLKNEYQNDSGVDSLGALYGVVSSTQGGWPILHSEGRYMGAAAWGNSSRLTNRYYRQLREILHLASEGRVFINRSLAAWHLAGLHRPYGPGLADILGEPIPAAQMWNPDAVLRVEDVKHAPITLDRVEKAAALQLVFEDGLFHVIDHWVRKTGADALVMAGGTALNCLANMRLLEHFDEAYYERYLGRRTRLRLWVPPMPGDAGVAIGAAVQFAMRNGVRPVERAFETPYLCGFAPTGADIAETFGAAGGDERFTGASLRHVAIGNIGDQERLRAIARLMAHAVKNDGVIGIFQGAGETGPRALGNRSIVANPCNPRTLETLNARVKYRERIRPLAPILTLEAAKTFFELSPGAAADDFDAYSYMVMTVNAKEGTSARIPAVVHVDGTARIQIVRQEANPLIYAYLKALGEELGVEVSVNTSLNVGSPIVQTAAQALDVLAKAKAMDGLFLVTSDGVAHVAWLAARREDEMASRMGHWLEACGFAAHDAQPPGYSAVSRGADRVRQIMPG
jgi:carbamoyltransferase